MHGHVVYLLIKLSGLTHFFGGVFCLCAFQLHQQCEDRNVLRYVYYYLARILADSGGQGVGAGGGIPTPNWDALADIDAVGGVTRADVVPRVVAQLTAEASNSDSEGSHSVLCTPVHIFSKTYSSRLYYSEG